MEMEIRAALELHKPRLLQKWVVIGIEVVETVNGPTVGEEPPRQMKADKAGRAGHQNGLIHLVIPRRPCSITSVTAPARFAAIATVNRASASAAASCCSDSVAATKVPPARLA